MTPTVHHFYLNMALQSKDHQLCHLQYSTQYSKTICDHLLHQCMTEAVLVETTAAELCQLGIEVQNRISKLPFIMPNPRTNPRTSVYHYKLHRYHTE